ncbi:MAG TPA: hypothetical protein VHP11_08130 [Tepidisphaeraceae bacterium]|nr:hypothetical protein [Tepidisphaeraceae bacterium]
MKSGLLMVSCLLGLVFLMSGCGKSEGGGIDTSKLQSAFSGAEVPAKAEVQKAITAIKAGEWTQALTALREAAKEARLTPEQQAAIKDVLQQVQTKVTGAVQSGAEQAKEAAGDLQKSLSK